MEFIDSKKLMHCTGHLVPCEKAFKNKHLVILYFANSTSASCKQFLPKLKAIYNKSKEIHLAVEVIYISYDEDEHTMMTNFTQRHGGWFAVPYGDPAKWVLQLVYDVIVLPTIIVLGTHGYVVSKTGVQDYEKYGLNVLVQWNLHPPR